MPRDILNKEDKYAIENLLAKGGMAMVFKAKDKNCRRPVALKVINDSDLQNQEVIHRFIEEAQIAAQLDHPNILPVYDLNIDKLGNPFYAMKLVKGDTLENLIVKIKQKDKKTVEEFPLTKLLQIYLKVCEAVAFAASRGVVHRDLKPENIMIGEYGEVFIMDWGIAKVSNEDKKTYENETAIKDVDSLIDSIRKDDKLNTSTTMQGQILGTPGFMAPEQVLSSGGQIGPHTDVYALGGILYNIISLERPHAELDVKTLFLNKIEGKIPTPEKRAANSKTELVHIPNKKIPGPLSSICQKAMNVRPEARYKDAAELLEDLNLFMNGFATQAEGASQVRLIKLLLFRHQRLTIGLCVLMTMIILLLTQNYFKLVTARVEGETAMDIADGIQLQKSNTQFNIKSMQKAAKEVIPEFEDQVQSLIEQGGHAPEHLKRASKFLRLAESPKLYIYKAEILMKFSRPVQARRVLQLAIKTYPDNSEIINLAESLDIK